MSEDVIAGIIDDAAKGWASMSEDVTGSPTIAGIIDDADGISCRFCGESSGEIAPGSAEYAAFWAVHDTAAHKLTAIRVAVGRHPADDVLAALIDVLIGDA